MLAQAAQSDIGMLRFAEGKDMHALRIGVDAEFAAELE
jgi:hypothetical protein